MKDSDLIIPGPIPFGDVTLSDAEQASDIIGVSPHEIERDIEVNPKGVIESHLIPIGNLTVNFKEMASIGGKVGESGTIPQIISAIRKLEEVVRDTDGKTITKSGKQGGKNYREAIGKMLHWLEDPIGRKPPFEIFAKGNKKLPFWAFSALPDATCPGAGDCLRNPEEKGKRGWCYSFSSWQYIIPYFRQLQNTILIKLQNKSWIEQDARDKFKDGEVVRLYVDGDIDSLKTLDYWMHFCERFPRNSFYGYTKSWGIVRQWHNANNGAWPENYVINLSSGTSLERKHIKDPEVFRAIVRGMLDIKNPVTGKRLVRGTFRAVDVGTKYPKLTKYEEKRSQKLGKHYRVPGSKSQEAWNIHRAEVKSAAIAAGIRGDDGNPAKVFACPGKCFACMTGGRHACGDRSMQGWAIVIGIH